MLKKTHRISNPRLILKLSKQGKVYQTRWFVFKFLPSLTAESQFGLSISKKVASKAVQRNKLKRQIYESLRLHLISLPRPLVCFIFLKKGIPEKPEFKEIDAQVAQFINHLHSNV